MATLERCEHLVGHREDLVLHEHLVVGEIDPFLEHAFHVSPYGDPVRQRDLAPIIDAC